MRRVALFLVAIFLVLAPLPSALAQAYAVTNLFSDGSVPAVSTDPGFQNPWGVSVSGTWWISTANTGFNYVISSATNASTVHIMVPPGSGTGTGTPAGSVTTNGSSGTAYALSNGAKASFLFATLDGTVSGWNGTLGLKNSAVALIAINNSSAGASYPGLAILNSSATTSYILVPNFGAGNKIEVYDQNFKPTALSGSFTDPTLPAGYSPWSIHILNGQIWVAYAMRAASAPYIPITGPGNGIVDVFDLNGKFVARAVTGGNLNAPWGIAFAPLSGFGIFSGDLLIGNFGDGKINVYDPNSYAYLGQLVDSTAKPLSYATLWELLTGGTPVLNGTSTSGGLTSTVYFTAGLTNEQHGLLGAINSTTVSGAAANFAFSSSSSAVTVPAGTSANVTLALVPVNNFSGTVTFTCGGLPSNSSCLFSPNTLTVTGSAPATTALSITTEAAGGMARFRGHRARPTLALASVVPLSLLPFALFLRRRRSSSKSLRLFGPLLILILSCSATALILGCGSSSSPPMATPFTPTGHSVVTVTATSGGATQTTTIALTVQ